MARVHRRVGVDDDITEIALYLLPRGTDLAARFIEAVEMTLTGLATAPGLGSPKQFKDPRLHGLRSWPVVGFPNHLVFYQPVDDGIMVLAVVHGARDLPRVLGDRP